MKPDAGFYFDTRMSPRVYLYDATSTEILTYYTTGAKTVGMLFTGSFDLARITGRVDEIQLYDLDVLPLDAFATLNTSAGYSNGSTIYSYIDRSNYPALFAYLFSGNDVLSLSNLNDGIDAGGGADRIDGLGGNDTLSGGAGNDVIDGGSGNDTLDGGTGNDLLVGGIGLDTASFAGRKAQHAVGWNGTDWIISGTLADGQSGGTDILRSIENLKFSDAAVSLLDLVLGTPAAPDTSYARVHRYLNTDNGHYFYTGNPQERASIAASYPQMRAEGEKFLAQDNWVTGYLPVYGFVNTLDGSRFYTINPVERDVVLRDYTHFRYEQPSFFVPGTTGAGVVQVYRLANLTADGFGKGAYLYTSDPQERAATLARGGWRDDGFAFFALDPARVTPKAREDAALAYDVRSGEAPGAPTDALSPPSPFASDAPQPVGLAIDSGAGLWA